MHYPRYRNANSNATTAKQAAAIKPDDAYDMWYHKDTSMKFNGRKIPISYRALKGIVLMDLFTKNKKSTVIKLCSFRGKLLKIEHSDKPETSQEC